MSPRNWWNIDNITEPENKLKAIGNFLKDVYSILNKNVSFADNVRGAMITVTFGAANVDKQIRHGLDFVPTNYWAVKSSVAMNVYDGSVDPDKTYIYLKSDAVGTADIFLF